MTIGELAERTGLTKHTLRYYERTGLVPRVGRQSTTRHRQYDEMHVNWVAFLRDLRCTGMPIREVRIYVKLLERGEASWPERRRMLAAHRDRVREAFGAFRRHLIMLDEKVASGCAPEVRQRQETGSNRLLPRSID